MRFQVGDWVCPSDAGRAWLNQTIYGCYNSARGLVTKSGEYSATVDWGSEKLNAQGRHSWSNEYLTYAPDGLERVLEKL